MNASSDVGELRHSKSVAVMNGRRQLEEGLDVLKMHGEGSPGFIMAAMICMTNSGAFCGASEALLKPGLTRWERRLWANIAAAMVPNGTSALMGMGPPWENPRMDSSRQAMEAVLLHANSAAGWVSSIRDIGLALFSIGHSKNLMIWQQAQKPMTYWRWYIINGKI